MRRAEMMTAGGVTLAGLGALVGLAIGSGDAGPKALAPRAQPVEVRTEVIRKTVNVYRREHPHHAAGKGVSGRGSAGSTVPRAAGALSASARTRSSGAHAVASTPSAALVVSTRSSGSHSTPSESTSGGRTPRRGSGSHTVKTRSSGSRQTSGSHAGGSTEGGSGSHPIKTRTSGGSASGGGSGASRPVSTRSSGGAGGEGGDHGGGHDD